MSLFDDSKPAAPLRATVKRKTAMERRLEILEKVRSTDPSILEAIEQGRMDPYLPTVETRNAFCALRPSEQIFAAFWDCPGVDRKKLLDLCRHAGQMERAGLLRDLRVDRSKLAPPVSETEFPPGVEIGPELALAALQCKQAMRKER